MSNPWSRLLGIPLLLLGFRIPLADLAWSHPVPAYQSTRTEFQQQQDDAFSPLDPNVRAILVRHSISQRDLLLTVDGLLGDDLRDALKEKVLPAYASAQDIMEFDEEGLPILTPDHELEFDEILKEALEAKAPETPATTTTSEQPEPSDADQPKDPLAPDAPPSTEPVEVEVSDRIRALDFDTIVQLLQGKWKDLSRIESLTPKEQLAELEIFALDLFEKAVDGPLTDAEKAQAARVAELIRQGRSIKTQPPYPLGGDLVFENWTQLGTEILAKNQDLVLDGSDHTSTEHRQQLENFALRRARELSGKTELGEETNRQIQGMINGAIASTPTKLIELITKATEATKPPVVGELPSNIRQIILNILRQADAFLLGANYDRATRRATLIRSLENQLDIVLTIIRQQLPDVEDTEELRKQILAAAEGMVDEVLDQTNGTTTTTVITTPITTTNPVILVPMQVRHPWFQHFRKPPF